MAGVTFTALSLLFPWMLAVMVGVTHKILVKNPVFFTKRNMGSFYNLLTGRTTYKAFLLLSQVDQN